MRATQVRAQAWGKGIKPQLGTPLEQQQACKHTMHVKHVHMNAHWSSHCLHISMAQHSQCAGSVTCDRTSKKVGAAVGQVITGKGLTGKGLPQAVPELLP